MTTTTVVVVLCHKDDDDDDAIDVDDAIDDCNSDGNAGYYDDR